MNRFNLRRVERYGASLLEPPNSSGFQINGASRQAYGFGLPPSWTESDRFTPESEGRGADEREFAESHPVLLAAGRAIVGLARVDQAHELIRRDSTLSDLGRRQKLREPGIAFAKLLAEQHGAVSKYRAAHRERHGQFYAPKALAAADIVDALLDGEIRAHFRSLDPDKQIAAVHSMLTGRDERSLLALMRSPVQVPLADRLKAAWRDIVDQREPAKAAALKAEAADVEWSEHVISATASYAQPFLPPRAELWSATREIEGARDLFNFSAPEIATIEHSREAA